MGGFVGGLVISAVAVILDWRRARSAAVEGQRRRTHELQVLSLEQRHQLELAAMNDAARLRDARFARLNEDAKELARALFDLERLALLMQWGRPEDDRELEHLEASARAHFESARAGLTLDPDGGRLTGTFESITREIAQYQSMIRSHRVLVEARAIEQAVDHADQMQAQRDKVVDGINVALRQIQSMLTSAVVPVEVPTAPLSMDEKASTPAAAPLAASAMELIPRSP